MTSITITNLSFPCNHQNCLNCHYKIKTIHSHLHQTIDIVIFISLKKHLMYIPINQIRKYFRQYLIWVRYVSFWQSEMWILWGMYRSGCLKNYCECYEVCIVLAVWKITVNVMRYITFWLSEKLLWMLWGMFSDNQNDAYLITFTLIFQTARTIHTS
jgi:hypothetical protein